MIGKAEQVGMHRERYRRQREDNKRQGWTGTGMGKEQAAMVRKHI